MAMKTRFLVGFIFGLLMGKGSSALAESAQIVSPDGPLPCVVASGQKPDQDAAADLCDYLSRVTGKSIAPAKSVADTGTVIHVGLDAFSRQHAPEVEKLFADGYVIKCVTKDGRLHIILAGRQAVSATWAVEQFLKDVCGVRFLFPDPQFGEVVPAKPVLTIDSAFNQSYSPHYVSRYASTKSGHAYYTPNKQFLRGRTRWYGYGEHALQFLFSEPEFKAHPEWFAFFNGKRQWWSYGNGWQICTTNPDTVKHAVNRAIEFFDKNPDVPVFSVGLNDGYGWCECPQCTRFVSSFTPAYTLSDRWFHWVNEVAREVGKKYPDKWIETMAYAVVSAPPRFAMEPNVAVTVTIVVPENLAEAEQWTKICRSVNLYSYMYGASFLGFRHYPHAAKEFLKWGHDKLGSLAHITEAGGEWTYDGPKFAYLNALQWDVNTDVDALMADYCASSYGAAAEPMKAFWNRLEQIYERRDPSERLAFYVWVGWQQAFNVAPNHELKDYTQEDVQAMDGWINDAVKLAQTDTDAVKFRVDRLDEAWRYFRSAVISKLRYTDQKLPAPITSQSQLNDYLAQAKEIAALRADRSTQLAAMRLYPELNPNAASPAYWCSFTGMTLFNRELTLLDALASEITRYLVKDGRSAVDVWKSIIAADPLYETAQLQLKLQSNESQADVISNGDFESGKSTGWEVEGGDLSVGSMTAHGGRYSAETRGSGEVALVRKLAVRDRQRYRLEGWCKTVGDLPACPLPLDSIIEFYGDGQRLWHTEPVRNVPYAADEKGWLHVRSVFDVPPGADSAVVKLRKQYNGGAVLWDDLSISLLRDATTVDGVLADDFKPGTLDQDKWFPVVSSGGDLPIVTEKGMHLTKDRCPIISHSTFAGLLKGSGPTKARLQLHVQPDTASAAPGYLKWGFQTGLGMVGTTEGTGIWWMQEFGPDGKPGKLLIYSHQNGKVAQSEIHDLAVRADLLNGVWYSFVFDGEYLEVYTSGNGFNESEGTLVARFAHGITDFAANGGPRLKLEGQNCVVQGLSCLSPKTGRGTSAPAITNDPADRNNLAIPEDVNK